MITVLIICMKIHPFRDASDASLSGAPGDGDCIRCISVSAASVRRALTQELVLCSVSVQRDTFALLLFLPVTIVDTLCDSHARFTRPATPREHWT